MSPSTHYTRPPEQLPWGRTHVLSTTIDPQRLALRVGAKTQSWSGESGHPHRTTPQSFPQALNDLIMNSFYPHRTTPQPFPQTLNDLISDSL